MSGYAYKCPVCGGGFVDGPEPLVCCGETRTPYRCGLSIEKLDLEPLDCDPDGDASQAPQWPKSEIGFPYVIGDELHGHGRDFNWAAGQSFTSKSERDRVLKAKGLSMMGFKEAQREGLLGSHPSPTMTYSYKGQTRKG